MASGIPIILGGLSPNLPRGRNPAHTIDELKIMLDVENGGAISGKGSYGRTTGTIEFAAQQPRVATSNATDPHEFVAALPPSFFAMAPHEHVLPRPDP